MIDTPPYDTRQRDHIGLPASQVRAMIQYRARQQQPYLNVKVPISSTMHGQAGNVYVPITPEAALQVLERAADEQTFNVQEELWQEVRGLPEGWTMRLIPTPSKGRRR